MPLPAWAMYGLGYVTFGWTFLKLITLGRVTPDMLMSGFLFLAAAFVLKIEERPKKFWPYALLGILLGVGYWAKTPMFPLAFVCFGVVLLRSDNRMRTAPRLLASVVLFALVAAPWVVALSKQKGRFTFGDNGRFNYLVTVDHIGLSWYMQDIGTAGGHYIHNPRQIFDSPPIYEFGTPIKGTLPIWNDPSYWTDGLIPKFHLGRQIQILHKHLMMYLDLIFTDQTALVVGFLILAALAGRALWWRQLTAGWPLTVIGLGGLAMYALVLVEPRYIGQLFLLTWLGLFCGLMVPEGPAYRRFLFIVVAAVVAGMSIPLLISAVGDAGQVVKGRPHTHWNVAQDLHRHGIKAGEKVGRIGGNYGVGWARMARIQVVAEVPLADAKKFFDSTPELQGQVIEAFRPLGVTAIISEQIPPYYIYAHGPNWIPLADGSFYLYKVTPQIAP